jgi:hypothetical protein
MAGDKLKTIVTPNKIQGFINAIKNKKNGNVTVNQVLQAIQKHVLNDIYLVNIKGAKNKFSQFKEDNQNIYNLMKTITERHMRQLGFFCKLIFTREYCTIANIEHSDLNVNNIEHSDLNVNNIDTLRIFIEKTIQFDNNLSKTSGFEVRSTNQYKNPAQRNKEMTSSMTQTVVKLLLREFSKSDSANANGTNPTNKSNRIRIEHQNYLIIMGGLLDTLSKLYKMLKPTIHANVFIPTVIKQNISQQSITIGNEPDTAGASDNISELYKRIIYGINNLLVHRLVTTATS